MRASYRPWYLDGRPARSLKTREAEGVTLTLEYVELRDSKDARPYAGGLVGTRSCVSIDHAPACYHRVVAGAGHVNQKIEAVRRQSAQD